LAAKFSTIERTPEYIYHKALVNRAENRPLDALELLRSAVERAPEKPEYRAELASLYADLGSMRQSDELVLEALSKGENRQQFLYQLALNRMAERDLPRALHSLELFRQRDPENDEASMLSEQIRWHIWMENTWQRGTRRAGDMMDRACTALRDGDAARASALAREVKRRIPEWKHADAVHAAAQMSLGKDDRAFELAMDAARGAEVSVRALVLSAQVMIGLGRTAEAVSMLRQAAQMAADDVDIWMCIRSLALMELHQDAEALTRRAVADKPFDRWFLHAHAVALAKVGKSLDEAAKCWERILRIDPEDGVAWHCHEQAAEGTLDRASLRYEYKLPHRAEERWARELVMLHQAGEADVRRRWREDIACRRQIRWALGSESVPLRMLALSLLQMADSPEAGRTLRERLMARDVSVEERNLLMHRLMADGAGAISPDVEYATPEEWIFSDDDVDLEDFTIGERQAMRYTAQVIDDMYGLRTFPSIVMLYAAYRGLVPRTDDPLTDTEPLCAALALLHLKRIGKDANAGETARAFGCTRRRTAYYASRILHVIQGVIVTDEDL